MAQSFRINDLQIVKAEIREHYIALGFGSDDESDSDNNMIKVYSSHNDYVQLIHQVGPGDIVQKSG